MCRGAVPGQRGVNRHGRYCELASHGACAAEYAVTRAQVSISGCLGGEWGVIREDNACLIHKYRIYHNTARSQSAPPAPGPLAATTRLGCCGCGFLSVRLHVVFYEAGLVTRQFLLLPHRPPRAPRSPSSGTQERATPLPQAGAAHTGYVFKALERCAGVGCYFVYGKVKAGAQRTRLSGKL